MYLNRLAVALALSLSALTAHAEFMDSGTLLKYLESPKVNDRDLGLGFIMGVSDAHQETSFYYHYAGKDGKGCFRLPSKIIAEQVRQEVLRFLRAPETWKNVWAYDSVRMALAFKWPCG